jgi:hypothetical protein
MVFSVLFLQKKPIKFLHPTVLDPKHCCLKNFLMVSQNLCFLNIKNLKKSLVILSSILVQKEIFFVLGTKLKTLFH